MFKYRVTSPYGMRTLNGETAMHKGIDIVYADGYVRAFADGIVKASLIIRDKKNKTWEWGEYIRVEDGGKKYYYCHMKERFAKVGDEVKKGDILGIMGNTGKSYNAHTHFEIRDYWDSLDPSHVLKFIKNVRGTYELMVDKVSDVVEVIKDIMDKEEVKLKERYNKIEDVPVWALPTVSKMIEKKLLYGDENGNLNLSEDMIRVFVVMDRTGIFK